MPLTGLVIGGLYDWYVLVRIDDCSGARPFEGTYRAGDAELRRERCRFPSLTLLTLLTGRLRGELRACRRASLSFAASSSPRRRRVTCAPSLWTLTLTATGGLLEVDEGPVLFSGYTIGTAVGYVGT